MSQVPAPPIVETPSPGLSIGARVIAVFARPTQAWAGLETRPQWWFPMIVTTLVNAVFSFALYERAVLPMMASKWSESVESGQMTAEQMDKAMEMMHGPTGKIFSVLPQIVVWPLVLLLMALVVWFGVGFVLGSRFRYRLALEVAAWSSLVLIPGQIITGVIAWNKETLQGVHLGLAALLPEPEAPSKLMNAVTVVLDALGPFSIWWLVVGILGAAALSGAPRKPVAWVLVGLYLAFAVFGAAATAMFGPGH